MLRNRRYMKSRINFLKTFIVIFCIKNVVSSTQMNEELEVETDCLYKNIENHLIIREFLQWNDIWRNIRGGDQPDTTTDSQDIVTEDSRLEDSPVVDKRDDSMATEINDNHNKREETMPAFGRATLQKIGSVKHRISKGWSRRGHSSPGSDRSLFANMKDRLHDLKTKRPELDLDYRIAVDVAKSTVSKVYGSISGPIVSTILSQLCIPNEKPLTTTAVFLLSLLGSSLGFHSFLYFVSIGFGLAVGFIATAALITFNVSQLFFFKKIKTNSGTSDSSFLWFVMIFILISHLILPCIHKKISHYPKVRYPFHPIYKQHFYCYGLFELLYFYFIVNMSIGQSGI